MTQARQGLTAEQRANRPLFMDANEVPLDEAIVLIGGMEIIPTSMPRSSVASGPFGPIFTEYKHDAQGAIERLVQEKTGEAIAALHHPDIGDIDLVWGKAGSGKSDGYGLAKIVEFHPEVLDNLQDVVAGMKVKSRSKNRVMLESDAHMGWVRLTWDGEAKHWLLTAFLKDEYTDGAKGATFSQGVTDGGLTQSSPSASDDIIDRDIRNFYQPHNKTTARGAFNPDTLNIALLKNADLSTFLHETGHFFLEVQADLAAKLQQDASVIGDLQHGAQQIVDDMDALLKWFGVPDLNTWQNLDFEEKRHYHEQFARGFEAYLFEGKSPSIELQGLFQRFRAWMLNVYRSLKSLNVELSDEVRGVMDRMLASNEQILLAEQGRSMLPLFETADQAGMTPEEFAAYQALGTDATQTAVEELQARGLRDMKWLHNARSRKIKQLQRDAKAQRAEVEMDVRREVLSQPIYQAWQFLKNKVTDDDKLPPMREPGLGLGKDQVDETRDSLLTAIAKLGGVDRAQAQSEWGLDPKEKSPMPMFGKYVLRREGGMELDRMAEALYELGYLDERDLHEFEDKFLRELRGETVNSVRHDYTIPMPGDQVVNPAAVGSGRLDRGALQDMGLPDEVVAKLEAERMVRAEGGWHPDIVADKFDLTSGDELVHRIAELTPPDEEIAAITDQRMLAQYGDLASPEAIAQAADKAIHNDVRMRMVATEANVLAKATGGRKVLAAAAKEFARATIARLKIRSIRPSQYANAEARAAKASDTASRQGDLQKAAAEKRNQLVQGYAAKAAHDALDEVEKGVRYLKKFASDGVRKNLDSDYMDQIDTLLDRFELRKRSNKELDKLASISQWIEAQLDAGLPEPDLPDYILNDLNRTNYRDMTLEQFRGLIDSIKQIEHLARLKHRLLTAKEQREFAAIVEQAAETIVENGGDARELKLEGEKGVKYWLQGFLASHRKLNSLLRQFDGGKDGGFLWELLGRTMNEAATNELTMNEQATERLAEIYAPILKLKGGVDGDKRYIPAISNSLSRAGRLSIALNWGNETNRKRIMDGDQWSEIQVQAILATLSETEAQFVNEMHEFIDSYWPDVAAKEKRVTGREPEKVEAMPWLLTTANGKQVEMRGGYYPIKYDAQRDSKAEAHDAAGIADDMKRGAFTRSTTRRGHTKQRADQVNRPVKKSLDVITQHISEVVHDLVWHEWLIDANRIIGAKPIERAIRDHYGPEILRTIKDVLSGIATADIVPQTKIDTAMLYLRANVSRSTMGFSLTTAMLQPFGLFQSVVRIGPKHVLRGMARWGGDTVRFENAMSWISDKSEFMRLRNKTFNRELHEINGRVTHGKSTARQVYDASLFMLIQKMQLIADVPTWIGAYEKALAEGSDDDRAIAIADQAVLDSQGGGQIKDLSEFQRKHPLLTMFYSYFNTTYNLAAESTGKTDFKSPLQIAGWLSDMAMLMAIPALGPAIILELLKGGGDDDDLEAWMIKMLQWEAGYLMATVVGLRELSGAVQGFDYSGPPVGRLGVELTKLGKQIEHGEIDEALVMSVARTAGVAFGLPMTQLIRSYTGWKAWTDGDAPATSVLMGPPPRE